MVLLIPLIQDFLKYQVLSQIRFMPFIGYFIVFFGIEVLDIKLTVTILI